jgi:tubulin beta
MVNYFQNENIKQICIRENRKKVGFGEMNSVVARAMAGSTISMRFPGSLNTSLRKLATNLVPLFRLHFIATGLAPIGKKSYSAADMMETAYSK